MSTQQFHGERRGPDLVVSLGGVKELKNLIQSGKVDLRKWLDGRTSQTLLHVAAAANQVEMIELLTSWSHPVSINAQDREGNTALHVAVIAGHREAMNALLSQNIDDRILNNDKDPALHIALMQCPEALDLIKDFIDHTNVHLLVKGRQNQTSLHVLTKYDNVDVFKLIHVKAVSRMNEYSNIGTPYNVLAKDSNGATIMHAAARLGAYRIMEFMFSVSSDCGLHPEDLMSTTSYDKRSPLHYAVEYSQVESIRVLLKHGANCTILSGHYSPPIHMACSKGKLDIVKMMVDISGKDILQARDKEGGTVLHSSTSFIRSHVLISYLVENGVGVDEVDNSGLTPLANAILLGNAVATESLLMNGADPLIKDKQGCNALYLSVLGKRTEVFKDIVKLDKAKVMAQDPNNQGMWPIHCALKLGLSEMLDPLLTLTHDCSKDGQGNNYIHLAAISGSDKTLLHMLNMPCAHAMVNEANDAGFTPLHLAAVRSSITSVQKLIDHGSIIHKSNTGLTPFMFACSKGNSEAAQLLFSTNKFQKDWVDHCGNTSLHFAVDGRNPHIISFCLDEGIAITLNVDGISFFDKILSLGDQMLAEAALRHMRWEECIDIVSPDKRHPLLRILDDIPEAYGIILDQSFSKCSCDPSHYNYWEEFNFKGVTTTLHSYSTEVCELAKDEVAMLDMTQLHAGSGINEEDIHTIREELAKSKQTSSRWHLFKNRKDSSPLAIVRKLIKNKHEEYLLHPVVVAFIRSMWNGFGQYFHLSKIFSHFFLALLLTIFVSIITLPQQYSSSSRNTSDPHENSTCCEPSLRRGVQAVLYLTLLLGVINLLLFFLEIYIHRFHLFKHFHEDALIWMNFIAPFCTIVFLSSILASGLDSALWNAAAIAVCFSWLSVGFSLQLINFWSIGVYITILMSTTRLVFKVLMIMFVFLLAFAIPLHILVGSEESLQFKTIGLSLFAMLHSLIAVTDYLGFTELEQTGQLRFSIVIFMILVVIIIMLPIVVINILIGLAVGDIARIQKDAIISHRAVEVRALTHLDNFIFPQFIFKHLSATSYKHYPNQRKSIWGRITNIFHKFDGDTFYSKGIEKPVEAVVREVLDEERKLLEKRLVKLGEQMEELVADQIEQSEGLRRLEAMMAKLMQAQGL